MTDKTYNGWSNYATWRVNLEIFDGGDFTHLSQGADTYQFGHELREHAEELICGDAREGLARDYALAFLADVNWTEIAKHQLEDYCEEEATR